MKIENKSQIPPRPSPAAKLVTVAIMRDGRQVRIQSYRSSKITYCHSLVVIASAGRPGQTEPE